MHTPLADQIRPASLDDVVGQRQLLASGKPLRRIIESGKIPNMIFYGPSGVGKTTVARIIADSKGESVAITACAVITFSAKALKLRLSAHSRGPRRVGLLLSAHFKCMPYDETCLCGQGKAYS